MINLGTQSLTQLYAGTNSISAVYLGTNSIWPVLTTQTYIYLGHANQNTGSAGNTITKIDQNGNIIWQRVSPWLTTYSSQTSDLYAANNRVYTTQNTGNPSQAGTSSSYDANGVSLNVYSHNNRTANSVRADSSGNIYIAGARDNTTGALASVRKLTSTGSNIWRYDHLTTINSIDIDSSNAVYFGGSVNSNNITTRKLNSSGVSQWSANHGGAVNSVLVDSSGNLYTGGAAGTGGFTVRKYNSTGALQWSRGLSTHGQINSLTFDSAGNIWCGGFTASGNATWSVVEYNTNGTALGYYNLGRVEQMLIDTTNDEIYVVSPLRKYNSTGSLIFTYSVPNNRFINSVAIATY